jgi:hypothetical protein
MQWEREHMLIIEVLRCVPCSANKPKKPNRSQKMPLHPDAKGKPKEPRPFNEPKPLNQS